jgi:hypothetical protein
MHTTALSHVNVDNAIVLLQQIFTSSIIVSKHNFLFYTILNAATRYHIVEYIFSSPLAMNWKAPIS